MSANSNVVRNPQLVEYGKFVELQNDSRFPPISVIRQQYPDTSSAYNIPLSTAPLSSVEIYPKYAVLTYNAGGIGGTGPGGGIHNAKPVLQAILLLFLLKYIFIMAQISLLM